MNTEIAKALRPCLRNYIRWCWCLSAAICLMAWLSGHSGWAGVAAFNAFAVVWMMAAERERCANLCEARAAWEDLNPAEALREVAASIRGA